MKCSSCGAEVVWKVLPSGKRCPMQTVKSVYVEVELLGDRVDKIAMGPMPPLYISHFETCPHASQHSKKKKEDV